MDQDIVQPIDQTPEWEKLWSLEDYAQISAEISGLSENFVLLSLLTTVSRNIGPLVEPLPITDTMKPCLNLFSVLIAPTTEFQKSTLIALEGESSYRIQKKFLESEVVISPKYYENGQARFNSEGKIIKVKEMNIFNFGSAVFSKSSVEGLMEEIEKQRNLHLQIYEFDTIIKGSTGRGYDSGTLDILNNLYDGRQLSRLLKKGNFSLDSGYFLTIFADLHFGEILPEMISRGNIRRWVIAAEDYSSLKPERTVKFYLPEVSENQRLIRERFETKISGLMNNLISERISETKISKKEENTEETTEISHYMLNKYRIIFSQECKKYLYEKEVEVRTEVHNIQKPRSHSENLELKFKIAALLTLFDIAEGIKPLVVNEDIVVDRETAERAEKILKRFDKTVEIELERALNSSIEEQTRDIINYVKAKYIKNYKYWTVGSNLKQRMEHNIATVKSEIYNHIHWLRNKHDKTLREIIEDSYARGEIIIEVVRNATNGQLIEFLLPANIDESVLKQFRLDFSTHSKV